MFARAGRVGLALGAAATLAFGVGTAGAAVHTKRPLCRLGENVVLSKCTLNPAFARTICSSFVPALQQAAPGATFNRGYFPSWTANRVGCWYVVNGRPQGAYVSVGGGAFGGATMSDGKRYVGKAQAPAEFKDVWKQDMQSWQEEQKDACPLLTQAALDQAALANAPEGTPWALPQKTTVGGYPAITWDWCQLPHEKVGPFDPAKTGFEHSVFVLAGDVIVELSMRAPGLDITSDRLFPLAEQLIAKYKRFG